MTIDFYSEKVFARESSIPVPTSGAGDGGSEGLTYIVHSSSTSVETQRTEVISWVDANAPATLGGQDPASASLQEVGEGYWEVTLRYSTQQAQRNAQREEDVHEEGDTSWSFSISSTTQNIKLSRGVVSAKSGNTNDDNSIVNNFGSAPYIIGLDSDGNVNGIDILVPEASWEETYWTAAANVTQAYRLTCLGLVGKVNNATFKGASAHQVLLTGVSGQISSATVGGLWQITFSFAYMPDMTVNFQYVTDPNQKPATLSGPTAVSKTGWQVYDIQYCDAIYAGVQVALPKRILVQKVYEEGDFSQLNLP